MPAHDLPLLIEAARAAGEIANRYWRQSPEAWEKPANAGPVSAADLAVDRMLHAELHAARPGYGWLSEETEDHPARLVAERVFIVDPIDGTRAFLAGETAFAHSLAVAEAGRIIAAVVYLPQLGRLYSATLGGGAQCNAQPLLASPAGALEGATLLAPHPVMQPENWRAGVPNFNRAFRASLAYRLCLVAEGRYDGMLTLRDTWEWDVAAGDLIAREAGAAVTDRCGRGIGYNAALPRARGILAAPGPVHADLLAALRVPGCGEAPPDAP